VGQRRSVRAIAAALIKIIRLLLRHGDDMTCPRWLTRLATVTFGLYRGWRLVEVFVHVAPHWFSAAGRPTTQRGRQSASSPPRRPRWR